jgi:phosphatidylglycerophosphate synthase
MSASIASPTPDLAGGAASREPIATQRLLFPAALEALKGAQKPGAGVPAYTRWVNRRLAQVVAAACHVVGLSPNAVTAISAVLSFSGLALMLVIPAVWWLGFLVGGLLAFGYVLDSADGQVARLSKRGGPAGEWLDHVVDSIRTPAIHLVTFLGLSAGTDVAGPILAVPLLFCLLSVGQFMSQILAEQLSGARQPESTAGGVLQSLVLLPTDMGVLCLSFLLWGHPVLFISTYTVLFALGACHAAVSMRRKYSRLAALGVHHRSEATSTSTTPIKEQQE